MRRVTIIGVGSDHGNDRVGWQLIEQLRQSGFEKRFEPGRLALLICRFPAQLVSLLEDCEQAIIIDAVSGTPGTLIEFDAQDLLLSKDLHSTHGIGVGEALTLARRLLPEPVPVSILGVGIGEPDSAVSVDIDALLPDLQAWLDAALAKIA